MQLKTLLLTTLLPISLTLSGCGGMGGGASDAVTARENMMKDWSDAKEIMQKMVEKPQTFDAAEFQKQAQFLADSADSPWQHFSDAKDKNNATDAVWTDAAGFKAAAEKYQQATAQLNAAAKTATSAADVAPALKQVGASCGGCHKTYKVDE